MAQFPQDQVELAKALRLRDFDKAEEALDAMVHNREPLHVELIAKGRAFAAVELKRRELRARDDTEKRAA